MQQMLTSAEDAVGRQVLSPRRNMIFDTVGLPTSVNGVSAPGRSGS